MLNCIQKFDELWCPKGCAFENEPMHAYWEHVQLLRQWLQPAEEPFL